MCVCVCVCAGSQRPPDNCPKKGSGKATSWEHLPDSRPHGQSQAPGLASAEHLSGAQCHQGPHDLEGRGRLCCDKHMDGSPGPRRMQAQRHSVRNTPPTCALGLWVPEGKASHPREEVSKPTGVTITCYSRWQGRTTSNPHTRTRPPHAATTPCLA